MVATGHADGRLLGARKRRRAATRVEIERTASVVRTHICVQGSQMWDDKVPVVQ